MLPGKWRPFCLGLDSVLTHCSLVICICHWTGSWALQATWWHAQNYGWIVTIKKYQSLDCIQEYIKKSRILLNPSTIETGIFRDYWLSQCYCCWCPGSLCHQVRINRLYPSTRKDFNYLCYLNVEKWHEIQICLQVSWNKFSTNFLKWNQHKG